MVGANPRRIEKLRSDLDRINIRNTLHNQDEKYRIEKELDSLLEQEELYQRQRSRIN